MRRTLRDAPVTTVLVSVVRLERPRNPAHLNPVPAVASLDISEGTASSQPVHRGRMPRFDPRAARALVTPSVVAGILLAGIATFRMMLIVTHGEPSGVDFGNWLMFGHQALGHPLPGAANVTYPPVVPLLTVWSTNLFGVVWGTALLAGLASVAPAAGVFAACRLFGAGWSATLAAVLLAATSSSGEAAAWGGIPQLIGLGLAALALGLTQLLFLRKRWNVAACLGAALLTLGATSHLILAQAAAALACLLAIRVVLDRSSFGRHSWLGANGWLSLTMIAVLPCLVLMPLYLRLLPTVGQSFVSDASVSNQSAVLTFMSGLAVVYRDVPWLWKPALILTAVTPLLLWGRKHRANPLWAVATALIVSLAAEASFSGQDRLVYLAPIVVSFAFVLWLSEFSNGTGSISDHRIVPRVPVRVAISAAALTAVALMSVKGLAFFPAQRAFYGSIEPPGTVAGLDWLRNHTPADSLVAVPPVNGAPFGWWVQGYGRRVALVGSEDQWLNFPDERTRANEAVVMLSESDPLDASALAAANHLGVQYILLPWAWGGLSQTDLTAYEQRNPGSVVFDNAAMVIVHVPASCGPCSSRSWRDRPAPGPGRQGPSVRR